MHGKGLETIPPYRISPDPSNDAMYPSNWVDGGIIILIANIADEVIDIDILGIVMYQEMYLSFVIVFK